MSISNKTVKYAQASTAYFFPSGSRSKNHRPAIQIGAAKGCVSKVCCQMYSHGETITYFVPITAWNSASVGQPFRISQSKLGRKQRNVIPAPSQIHGCRKCFLAEVASSPSAIPEPKKSIECLFKIPRPAQNPKRSHSFGFPPFRMRSTIAAHAIQNTGSNAFIEKKLSNAK